MDLIVPSSAFFFPVQYFDGFFLFSSLKNYVSRWAGTRLVCTIFHILVTFLYWELPDVMRFEDLRQDRVQKRNDLTKTQ